MNGKKQVVNKLLVFMSGIVYFVMGSLPNIWGYCFSVILTLLLFCALCFCNFEADFWNLKYNNNRNFIIITGVIICLLNGAFFLTRWSASSKVRWMAGVLGIDSLHLFAFFGIIGVVISLPFVWTVIVWFCKDDVREGQDHIFSILSSKKFFNICIIISLAGILSQVVFSFSLDIWVDEAFSMAMIKHNYREMIELTAMDVHPPLYYIILKFFVDTIHILIPDFQFIYIAKIVSVFFFCLLWCISITKLYRQWGFFVAGMWAVTLIGMPNLIAYGVEIRMYSCGLFFVSAAFVFLYDIMTIGGKRAWILFVMFSLAAAYTHYFACIAVAFAWLFLLIWFGLNNHRQLKMWVVAAFITLLGYFPWLLVFFEYSQTVVENFWKAKIGYSDVQDYFHFLLNNSALLLCVGVIVVLLVRTWIYQKQLCINTFYAIAGICIPIGTIFVGVIVSILIRPVFISRYMFPGLACFWLGMLVEIEQLKKNFLKASFTVLVLVVSFLNIVSFVESEKSFLTQADKTTEFFETVGDVVYIMDNIHVQETIEEMSGCECYLWQKEIRELSLQVYDNLGSIESLSDIYKLLDRGKEVYYVECVDGLAIEELISESDLSYMDLGSYRAENTVEIYQIIK